MKSKSVRIINCNNLLCQVNVLLKLRNQFKDNQRSRTKNFTQNINYMNAEP